jgi:hypothetical protein
LPFDANAECIGGFFIWEMFALPSAVAVGVINNPSGFDFAR